MPTATPTPTAAPSGNQVVQDQQPSPADPGGGLIPRSAIPLPPAASHVTPGVDVTGQGSVSVTGANDIPAVALAAYRRAANSVDLAEPGCHLSWTLLAAIGRVESDHGQWGGAQLLSDGLSTFPIIGPALNGKGTALILDTDNGRLDGDTTYDHAVGPMQFIPSTWAVWGSDADSDGVANPFDINDATLAAARYLCAAGGDLATFAGQVRAVLAYNQVNYYVRLVLAYAALYSGLNPGPLPLPPHGPGLAGLPAAPSPTGAHGSHPPSRTGGAQPTTSSSSQPSSHPASPSHPASSHPASSSAPASSAPASSSPASSSRASSRPASSTPAPSQSQTSPTRTKSPTATRTPTPSASRTATRSSSASSTPSRSPAKPGGTNCTSSTGASSATNTPSTSSTASGCATSSGSKTSTTTAGVTGVAGFLLIGLAVAIAGTVTLRRMPRQH